MSRQIDNSKSVYCMYLEVKSYGERLNGQLMCQFNFLLTNSFTALKQTASLTEKRLIFSSAGWAFHTSWSYNAICVCLGGTNRNRCTQRLIILHTQTY